MQAYNSVKNKRSKSVPCTPYSSETLCFIWGSAEEGFCSVNLRIAAIRGDAGDSCTAARERPTPDNHTEMPGLGVLSPRTGKFLSYFSFPLYQLYNA